jgi:hypothetical protein
MRGRGVGGNPSGMGGLSRPQEGSSRTALGVAGRDGVRGAGPAQERTAQGAIVKILSRNSDASRGRGGGTAGRVAGRSTSSLTPQEARIDM